MTNTNNNIETFDALTALDAMERMEDGESFEQALAGAEKCRDEAAADPITCSGAEWLARVSHHCDRVRDRLGAR